MGWNWPFGNNKDQNYNNQGEQQSEQQPQYQTRTESRSYMSSKKCSIDPEDPQFMICTQTIRDGNGTYKKQTRVPFNEVHPGPLPFGMMRPQQRQETHQHQNNLEDHVNFMQEAIYPFKDMYQQIDGAIGQFFNDPFFIMRGPFGSAPFQGPPPGFTEHQGENGQYGHSYPNQGGPFGHQFQPNGQYSNQHQQKQQQQQNQNYYFNNSKEKDYNIKDL